MGQRDGGRLGRLFGRNDAADEDDAVTLSGSDEHAWWADRRSLTGAPWVASRPEAAGDVPPADEPGPGRWSADALFADTGFDPAGPGPSPPLDDGMTSAPVAAGLDEARLVLGVTSADDWDSISRAHRALAKQFHPDRLGDLSPDAQELGRQRMTEINRAYDTLRAHRPQTPERVAGS